MTAFQLVIQRRGPLLDLDSWIALEDRIREQLGDAAVVDGHDFGRMESNIFVLTDDPELVFEAIKPIIMSAPGLQVAYRALSGSDFTVLFPKELKTFDVA